jgi:tetratricopeptide (TPR) repeat protein
MSGKSRYSRIAMAYLLLAASGVLPAAAAEPPSNLLTLPQLKLEATSLVGDQAGKVTALTDGKVDTPAEFDAAGAETIDLVFGFAGETVSPESVVVTLANGKAAVAPARIDVLASTVSPRTGFKSLRTDPIDAAKPAQTFAFRPAAANWIMIRLSVKPGEKSVALAELAILGHQGTPKTAYAFSETPARAIDILSRLETSSAVGLAVSADEQRAFQAAKAGRLDAQAFADLALLASGVLDPAQRRAYLAHIDSMEAKARQTLAKITGPAERGEALLKWLHANEMKSGYRSAQTNLSVLLDSKTFNCVSSAVMYNILALRLGLDARAIEVPDHAFSIIYVGASHMDVETTNPLGFNPAREQIKEFERITGFRYIPQSHQDERREVTEAGLAAIIYYNRGVALSEAKRHYDALLMYFRAMSLDPEFASAAKNALASVANWSLQLSEQKQWQQALDIANVGVALAPEDAQLTSNRSAVWSRWATSLIDAGQQDEAVAVLKRAAVALPKEGFETMQALAYIKPGEDLVKAQKWEAALSATEIGLAKLDPAPRGELAQWRHDLFLRWMNLEIEHGRFDVAASALERGLATNAGDKQFTQQVGYLAQEWSKAAASQGYARGLTVLTALEQRFPGNADLKDAAKAFVWRQVVAMADSGRIDDGLTAIDAAGGLLPTQDAQSEIGAFLFDKGAKARMDAKAWEAAADFYARGLKRFPDNRLLKNNVAYLAQQWQAAAYQDGGAPAVAAVTGKLAAAFPGIGELGKSGGDQIARIVNDHVRAGTFEAAVTVLKDAGPQLADKDRIALSELVYDNWAKSRMAAGDWQGAASLYQTALEAARSSSLLQNNVAYMVQEWSRAAFAKGGVKALIPVTREAVAKFPELRGLGAAPAAVIGNAVTGKANQGAFQDGVALIEEAAEILPEDRKTGLFEYVYDHWAKGFMQDKNWREAIGIYDQGLQRAPQSSVLKHNRDYCAKQQG